MGASASYYGLSIYNQKQAKATFFVAIQNLEKNQIDAAAALLNRAIAKDSDYYAPYHVLGNIYHQKGNDDLALQMYKAALEKIGNDNKSSHDKLEIVKIVNQLNKEKQ